MPVHRDPHGGDVRARGAQVSHRVGQTEGRLRPYIGGGARPPQRGEQTMHQDVVLSCMSIDVML
eukprot:4648005-Pyramimonas_sp.AAC.1